MVLGSARALPQQGYFIYLQTENHQPFYVRLGSKVYSSTASGYLVMPRLSDTSYLLIAGFPANAFPEQYFEVAIRHKDAGYLLKNFGDKGWGLFNLQSMAVIMNSNASPEKKSPEISVIKKTDAFSALLANAVNDTSILYTTSMPVAAPGQPTVKTQPAKDATMAVQQPGEPKPDTTTVAKTTAPVIDWAAAASATPAKPAESIKPDTLPKTPANNEMKDPAVAVSTPPVVKKEETAPAPTEKTTTLRVAELLTDTSYIAVYTDGTAEKFDTVRISIPLDRPGIQMPEAPRNDRQPVYNMPDTVAQKVNTQKDSIRKDIVQKDSIQPNTAQKDSAQAIAAKQPPPVQQKAPEEQKKPEPPKKDSVVNRDSVIVPADTLHQQETTAKPIIPNSSCISIAWDSDIDKLRVKMLAAKNDDEKIAVAKKLFKQKCLTVKQVKALSELFLTDEGKYKWFDVSYPSVTDTANFPQLAELIKDNYYQSRFKAMIRH